MSKAKVKLKPQYSGNASRGFWKRVNALPQPKQQELYACGVLLQDIESRVLIWLQQAESGIFTELFNNKRTKS